MLSSMIAAALLSLFDGISFLTSYISGNNAFPSPLNPAEESNLLDKMDAGDKTARNILVERNLRLVAHIVKKFDNTQEDVDDLISIGTIGLIKAINTYKRHKNTRLATYAARCIENEILMHLRSIKKSRSEVLLFESIGTDKEGNEISLIDILESNADVEMDVTQKVEKEMVQHKLNHLNSREKRVLELRYGLKDGLKKTQKEISRVLGISRSYVSRIEKRAINKLQQGMASEGYQ
jgi:RNA polymerase sporulation-specific sigma factor